MDANPITPHPSALLMGLPIARTLSSIPSVMGSFFIVQHVLRDPRRRHRTLTRILLGMAANDLLFSSVSVLSSSVVPREMRPWVPFASGSWATCEATGFLTNGAAVSSAIYNASLTFYYLVTIRYGWTESRVRKVEPCLHFVPMLIGWGTAIPGLPLELYNPTPGRCFISDYPMGCAAPNSTVPCQRGANDATSRIFMLLIWVFSVFVFLVIAMVMIYRKLAEIDQAATNHREGSSPSSFLETSSSSKSFRERTWSRWSNKVASGGRSKRTLNRLQHQFATQAFLYCLVFFFTWIFQGVTAALLQNFAGTSNPIYLPFAILMAIFSPLQGFWNFFIYVRPRYLRYRREQRLECGKQNQREHQERLKGLTTGTQRAVALCKAVSVDFPELDDDGDGDDIDDLSAPSNPN